jgi:hypothetical protein
VSAFAVNDFFQLKIQINQNDSKQFGGMLISHTAAGGVESMALKCSVAFFLLLLFPQLFPTCYTLGFNCRIHFVQLIDFAFNLLHFLFIVLC